MKTKLFFVFALILGIIIASTVLAGTKNNVDDEEASGLRIETLAPTLTPNPEPTPTPSPTSTPLPTPTLIPTPIPPINFNFLELQKSLQIEVENAWFDVAVAVTDLQTDQTININGNEPRLPGCTINFFVLFSVVIDLQNGLYPEAEVGSLISSTIWGSNPVTARELLIKTGGGDLYQGIDKVNNLLVSLGLQLGPNPALFDHPPAYPEESRFGKVNNSITANQANQALTKLYKGEILSPQWRDYLLEKMTGVKAGLDYLIPAGVGQARVSHKNGFFWDVGGWVDNDIGIVNFERSGQQFAYAISLYMEQIPTKYADIPIGQKISHLVWQYFDNKY